MSNDSNGKVLVIERHIVTREVRPLPQTEKAVSKEDNKEEDKWCWTRIAEAKKRNGNDTKKCWSEVLQILFESCFVLVLFILENLLGIIFLILGVVFLNDCPREPGIPISLIVCGAVSMIHGITTQIIRWKWVDLRNKKDGFATCAQVILFVASIIHFAALFCACFMVFHIYRDVKTDKDFKGTDAYCHHFLYWLTFWLFVIMAIFGLIFIVVMLCLCCFILSVTIPDDESPRYIVVHHPNQANANPQPAISAAQPNIGSASGGQPVSAQQPNGGNQSNTVASPTTQ